MVKAMNDAELVLVTAAGFVDLMGARALDYLEQHAELAAGRGDRFSEEAWRDLAEVAAQLLRGGVNLT
jgi:hypothetical protein